MATRCLRLLAVGALAVAPARAFAMVGAARRPATALRAYSAAKRGGDAVALTSLAIWQQVVAENFRSELVLDLGAACLRGCRLTLCLVAAEALFLVATDGPPKPVPVEAAGVALLLNLLGEYAIGSGGYIPDVLAHSLSSAPAEAVGAYLTIVVWRAALASAFPPPP